MVNELKCAACGDPAPGDYVLTYSGVGHPICERHATTPYRDLRRLIELRGENERLKEALAFYAAPSTWFDMMVEWEAKKSELDHSKVATDGMTLNCPGSRARAALNGDSNA